MSNCGDLLNKMGIEGFCITLVILILILFHLHYALCILRLECSTW